MRPITFMVLAGETSGDILAAEVVEALRSNLASIGMDSPPQFFGAGGARMAAAGVDLSIDMTRYSVIGIWEVVKNYTRFKRLFDQLLQLAIERRPDVILCIDFSGFNRRFAAAIRRHVQSNSGATPRWNPKIVQYVSPQVWASREGRTKQIERDFDLLLSIFPFEKAWYAERTPKLRVEFVGHPLLERYTDAGHIHPATELQPMVTLLPGSRVGELQRHLPVILDAARIIAAQKPGIAFRMILPSEDLKRMAEASAKGVPGLELQVGGLAETLKRSTLAIASTGTVTLECAFFGVPTVTLYKTSWVTFQIAKRIVKIRHLAMPNLLAGEVLYPELIQSDATGQKLAQASLGLLNDEKRLTQIKSRLAEIIASLGGPGASKRAAQAIQSLLR